MDTKDDILRHVIDLTQMVNDNHVDMYRYVGDLPCGSHDEGLKNCKNAINRIWGVIFVWITASVPVWLYIFDKLSK